MGHENIPFILLANVPNLNFALVLLHNFVERSVLP